ncbi:MAG: inositol monophosphatase family protein [Bacteroidota bacterium]|nr:inositol monophosphatase family protein [Bacteroidota bacterium]
MDSPAPLSFDAEALTSGAVEVIRPVGEYLVEQRVAEADIEVKGLNSLVSHVDKTAEARLVKGLQALLPEAGFLAEEGTAGASDNARFRWVVDPLDGTTNLIHGLPVFCVSVALVDGHQPVVAIVYDPNRDECFTAWQGGGTHLNGKPVCCADRSQLSDALVATGFPHWDFDRMDDYLEALTAYARGSRGIRRMGSAAIDLAYVACGRFDLFFEYSLQPWDIAAGLLLVQEAGGITCTFSGQDDTQAMLSGAETFAAAPGIAKEGLAVIRSAFG